MDTLLCITSNLRDRHFLGQKTFTSSDIGFNIQVVAGDHGVRYCLHWVSSKLLVFFVRIVGTRIRYMVQKSRNGISGVGVNVVDN